MFESHNRTVKNCKQIDIFKIIVKMLNIANKTCRLCLLEKENLKSMTKDNLQDEIQVILQIVLIQRENWPDSICGDCSDYLTSFQSYKETVVKNQDLLSSRFPVETECDNPIKNIEDKEGEDEDDNDDFELKLELEPESPLAFNEESVKTVRKRGRPKKGTSSETPVKKVKSNDSLSKKDKIKKRDLQEQIREMDEAIKKFMPIKCDLCFEEGFQTIMELRNHTKSKHRDYTRRIRIRCWLCKNVYDNRSKMYHHVNWHLNPEQYKCQECGKTFPNKDNLALHETMHMSDKDKPIECDICHQRFGLRRQLKTHMARHIPKDERKFQCDLCLRRFIHKTQLRDHLLTFHTDLKPFVCEICAKEFRFLAMLNNHIRTCHEKQVKVQCNQCNLFYANNLSLKRHIKSIHDDHGVHRCDECGHNSPNSKALKDHKKRIHEQTQGYPCKFCDKTMKNKTALKEHESTHTGALLYKCRFCPKEFNSNGNKYKHQKEKHREEWEEWHRQRKAGLL